MVCSYREFGISYKVKGKENKGFWGLQGWMDELAAQKDRLFLWAPVVFGVGIAVYFMLPFEPGLWGAAVLVLCAFAFLFYTYRRQHDSLEKFCLYLAAAGIFLAACGFMAATCGTITAGTPVLEKGVWPVDVIGTVESIENLGGKDGSRVVLTGLSIEGVAPKDTPKKVRLRFKKDEGIEAGQVISTLASIDPPSRAVLPGAYDFRRHLFFEGIGGVGFSFTAAKQIDPGIRRDDSIGLFFERLRVAIGEKIDAHAGAVSAGIMEALITGERGAIAEEDNEAMRDSGLYHLLSISGTHVTMVAGVLFFFSRFFMACFPWVALHWPIKKIAAVIALLGAAFYVFLAGADVPAQRALIMTALIMIAIMLDRSPFSLRLIAFAALVVLIVAPYAIVGVSFQMSFAAVATLICFFEYIRVWWTKWYSRAGVLRKSALYMIGLVMTSLIAGSVTGFFSLYHFQSFAWYGVLSNMIAVPITGLVIMPAAIVALLLMPFGWEAPALAVMEWGTLWMLSVAHWAAGLEGAVVHVSQWPHSTFVFCVGGIMLFLVWSGWRGKGVAVSLFLIGIVCSGSARAPDVMVAESGKLVAVQGADGDLYFSSGRRDKFTAENWLRLSGREGEKPKTFKDAGAPLRCDNDGCRGELKGRKVAVVFKDRAGREDCGWAEVMVAEIPVRCKGGVVVDLYDAKKRGAHAVFLGGGVVVRNVGGAEKQRPWE